LSAVAETVSTGDQPKTRAKSSQGLVSGQELYAVASRHSSQLRRYRPNDGDSMLLDEKMATQPHNWGIRAEPHNTSSLLLQDLHTFAEQSQIVLLTPSLPPGTTFIRKRTCGQQRRSGGQQRRLVAICAAYICKRMYLIYEVPL